MIRQTVSPAVLLNKRSGIAMGALLLAALACQDDARTPVDPAPATSQLNVSATAALTFWQMSAGGEHSCGMTTDNRAYCWGYNQAGQLGDGTAGPEFCEGAVGPFPCSTRPVLVAGGHAFRQVSAGRSHSCGLTTDNLAYCWGSNQGGALGDGTMTGRRAPVAVAGGLRFRQVDAGNSHTCGVTTDNRAFCWGANYFGELGDGTETQRLTPVAVAGGLTFKQVSASTSHYPFTCGVTTDGRAFCWGKNNYGQVGDSSTAARRVRPSPVSGGLQFRQVDAGDHHACGVTTVNRAYCWGNGRSGELGNGKTYLSFWPRAVAGRLSFGRVTAGNAFTCGETTADRAYCWGSNSFGRLGDGTRTARLTPVAVQGGVTFAQVSAGHLHTCGKTSAGEGYCWGYGFFGQMGEGSSGPGAGADTPVAVGEPR